MAGGEPTAYDLLEVSPSATPGEIRAAYLALIARYHPDRHAGHPLGDLAAEKAAALNQAYQILSDPGRRAAYDEQIRLASATAAARSRVTREGRALVILLRVLAIGVALIIVVRLAPLLWRAFAALFAGAESLLAGAAGTPLTLLAPLAIGTGIGIWVVRRRRRRRP